MWGLEHIFIEHFTTFYTYRTKCWKMNFKIEKLIGGSLFNKPRNARRRQLRSVLTSKFKFDGAPFRDKTDAENTNKIFSYFIIISIDWTSYIYYRMVSVSNTDGNSIPSEYFELIPFGIS